MAQFPEMLMRAVGKKKKRSVCTVVTEMLKCWGRGIKTKMSVHAVSVQVLSAWQPELACW